MRHAHATDWRDSIIVQIRYVTRERGRLRVSKPEILNDDDGSPFASIEEYCSAHDDGTFFLNLCGDARTAVLGRCDDGSGELFALADEGDNGWSNRLALITELR